VKVNDKNIKLTFYGGANEIGGNKVLLEDFEKDVKVFIDFGVNVKKLACYKTKFGNPTTINELTKHNFLPSENKLPIENFYSQYFLFEPSQRFVEKVNECRGKRDLPCNCDGIFISHAHMDHYYGLSFVNRNIPVYTGLMTKSIIEANSKSSPTTFENFYYGLDWQCFRTGVNKVIKGMEVIPVHVDHSIPAAYGFIFCTSEGLIIYTGDFRMHGPLSNMTDDFIEKIKECALNKSNNQVYALICEGTFIHKGSIESEENVKKQLETLFDSITFDYLVVKYNRTDWDRFRTFVNIAKKYDWKYIISERVAYFYHILNQDPNHDTMRDTNLLNDDNILILLNENQEDRLFKWQRELRSIFIENDKRWRLYKQGDLHKIRSKFFLYYTALQEPLSQTLPQHLTGAFISSDIDPYAEDKFDDNRYLTTSLRDLGLPGYRIQASGHAKPHDIYNFVKEINPKYLYPIHTKHAKMFKALFKNTNIKVILPRNFS
jgi:ribonuclease J